MYCKRCGATLTDKEEFCPSCGLAVAEPQVAVAGNAALKGVGGWLLLLCIVLTVVFPLNILYGTARSLRYHPDTLVLLLDAINIGLGVLSLAAGVMLWRVRKGAVRLAKILFVASSLHAVAVFCLVVFSGHMNSFVIALAIRILALPFLFSLLWYWYLAVSRRVRTTYAVVEGPN